MRKNNDIFDGAIDVEVAGQSVATRAQRRMLTEAFGDGGDVPGEVRFACRIALDVNEAIAGGVEFENGKLYEPNPKVRAQFGKNKRGKPYLTFGLIDSETRQRYTVTWEGAAVPMPLIRTAVAHDEGRSVKAVTVPLPFEQAKVHETGNKNGTGHAKKDKRPNHDTGPDGQPYARPPRRKHSRLCRSDLDVIAAMHKAKTN